MVFVDEISKKRKEIEDKSSLIERLYYHYLNGTSDTLVIDKNNPSNIEKIALNVFSKRDKDISYIVKKEQKADSNFEHHYSKSLIELSAMAIADPNFEKSNINSFLKSATLKEVFVLSKIVEDIELSNNYKLKDNIDKLVSDSFIEKNTSNFPNNIINALNEAEELIDIYTIEKCFENIIDIHPVENTQNKVKILLNALDRYNYKLEIRIKRRLFFWALIILLGLAGVIGYVLPTYWDTYNLDALISTIDIIVPILIFLLVLYYILFHQIESKLHILSNYIEKRKNKLNQKLGIDLGEIDKIRKEFRDK
jgi:hypothetical protein